MANLDFDIDDLKKSWQEQKVPEVKAGRAPAALFLSECAQWGRTSK